MLRFLSHVAKTRSCIIAVIQRKIGNKARDARFFFSVKSHRLKIMFDLSALQRLGLMRYIVLKLIHNNPVVETVLKNEISNLERYFN